MTARKKSTKSVRAPQKMPIAQERFAHMLRALLGHIRGLDRERRLALPGFARFRLERREAGEELDEATAREIADALYKLRAIYCAEALRGRLPNRRESRDELQAAANAEALVDIFGFTPIEAVQAASAKGLRVERDSAARTQRNRARKARLLGVEPQLDQVAVALKRRRKKAED